MTDRTVAHPVMAYLAKLLAWIAAALLPLSVGAQEYPARNVTLVVPGNPGGGIDFIGRVYAAEFSKRWKFPAIVENRSGASGQIGAAYAGAAVPDGYTLVMHTDSALAYYLFIKGGFNGDRDLTPIAITMSSAQICVVGTQAPAKTWPALLAYAKANPGKLNIADYPATTNHLEMLRLWNLAGAKVTLVPYNAQAPIVRGTLSNEITGGCITPGGLFEHVKAGKMHAVAVTGRERMAAFPEVPTMKEMGLDFEWTLAFALFAPAGTPKDIITRLQGDVAEIQKQPEVQARIAKLGYDPENRPPAETAELVRRASRDFRETARTAGIQPE